MLALKIFGGIIIAVTLFYAMTEYFNVESAIYVDKSKLNIEKIPWYVPPKFWIDSMRYLKFWANYYWKVFATKF